MDKRMVTTACRNSNWNKGRNDQKGRENIWIENERLINLD